MRSLERNKRLIHYALYTGKTPVVDEYGNLTGDYEPTYASPEKLRISVSAAKGKYYTMQFGGLEVYDKVMVTSDMDCPISETTILWVDKSLLDSKGKVNAYDYVVTRVAKGLNSISYAIKRVNVNNG